jgi:A/G-specific adenine glycosylase
MLQQTTVETAGPYFDRFVRRYPTIRDLAAAGEEEILALWSGLGYYHRARNMLKAARLIVDRHRGRVPRDMKSLRALPGVGPYTAGAILSIGHNLPFPALDGNVNRVITRLGAIEGDPARASTRRDIEALAARLMPAGNASAFNQALMDLGAMVCTPRRPACVACPVATCCRARREASVDRIPATRPSASPRHVELAAVAVLHEGNVMLVERGEGTLMKGLWEFPLVAAKSRLQVEREAARYGARLVRCVGQVRHTITSHRLSITVYEADRCRRPSRGLSPRRISVSEPAARLATPSSPSPARWESLDIVTRKGQGGLALTGAARKISRLLAAAR